MLVEIPIENRVIVYVINKPHDKWKWDEECEKISATRIRPNKKVNGYR